MRASANGTVCRQTMKKSAADARGRGGGGRPEEPGRPAVFGAEDERRGANAVGEHVGERGARHAPFGHDRALERAPRTA